MKINNKIVYSNVWEDPRLNTLALDVKTSDRVLSITSGGCNSLNLLAENPQKVVSIDVNIAQNALLELKIAAIKELNHEEFLELLGAEFYNEPKKFSNEYRIVLYEKIRGALPEYARYFWDRNKELIKNGIIMCGKVEMFFKIYRFLHKSLYYFDDPVVRLFSCENIEKQREYYDSIPMWRWNLLNWIFLNRSILSAVKGAHSFRYVEEKEFDKNLNRKVARAMCELDNKDNYFFALILLGKFFSREAVPPYLMAKNFSALKKNINKIEVFQGILTDVLKKYGENSFDKFNLSNIFEWMEDDIFNNVMGEVISLAADKARLCYRYTLAQPRNLYESTLKNLTAEPELAEKLHKMDRSFMYESFHVYEVKK